MLVKSALNCITLEYFLIQSDLDCFILACYHGKRKVVRELIEKYGMNQHIVSEVILIILNFVYLLNLFTHCQSVQIDLDLYMDALVFIAIYIKYLAQRQYSQQLFTLPIIAKTSNILGHLWPSVYRQLLA